MSENNLKLKLVQKIKGIKLRKKEAYLTTTLQLTLRWIIVLIYYIPVVSQPKNSYFISDKWPGKTLAREIHNNAGDWLVCWVANQSTPKAPSTDLVFAISTLSQNALRLPPRILCKHCFQFLLGRL